MKTRLTLVQLVVGCGEWDGESATEEKEDFQAEKRLADALVFEWHVVANFVFYMHASSLDKRASSERAESGGASDLEHRSRKETAACM